MSRSINLYLVRHAESMDNVSLGTQYFDDFAYGLTETGKEQAGCLGEYFKNHAFHRVYSSDYLRAIETAEITLKCQKKNGLGSGHKIETRQQLREFEFGSMREMSYSEKAMYCLKQKSPPLQWTTPDGESILIVAKRMLSCLENICAELLCINEADTGGPISLLVVTHSLSVLSMFVLLSEKDAHSHEIVNWGGSQELKILKNASFHKLKICKATTRPKDNDGQGEISDTSFPLRIEIMEQNFTGHLKCDTANDSNIFREDAVDDAKLMAERAKFYRTMKASENGKELLRCVQQ